MVGKSLNHLLCHAIPMLLDEMFLLPAELAKESGNDVLKHWMGNLGRGCQFHARSRDSVFFLFLPEVQQVFPHSLPLANSCLKFKEVYQPLGIFFSCRWLRFCYRCDGDRNVNKMLLHCRMVDEWHSVCEKYTVVMKWNSPLKIFWKIFKCCDMLNTHPNSLNRVYCSIWWKTLAEKKM